MNHISELAQLGTSTWLDDLSRERLVSGNLKEIISAKSIVGAVSYTHLTLPTTPYV